MGSPLAAKSMVSVSLVAARARALRLNSIAATSRRDVPVMIHHCTLSGNPAQHRFVVSMYDGLVAFYLTPYSLPELRDLPKQQRRRICENAQRKAGDRWEDSPPPPPP